ncbi:hypothetical protein CHH28_14235 [Bacterioplanes sanyensis]|uniref:Co-chaperone DjlA N-terminal domain-containing protein n=1 Tax=Bacterioplanes sanyensis TaxID=1249553 RepID=A0A222FLV4_9GAMM|nr:TerB family tellurite resistance protein [Bacterioplanes sanyensis]ASP39760.1 hypothetical protein CHH28_14235 [Bacterioplanes sanyensis]
MLKDLLNWFSADQHQQQPKHTVEKATAVLLVEIMRADHDIDADEINAFRHICQQHLNLNEEETSLLLREAQATAEQANDLFQFTDLLHQQLSNNEKFTLLLNLWRIAYASAGIDRYEEHMIRRIAELLYLPHSEFIRAKLLARDQAT